MTDKKETTMFDDGPMDSIEESYRDKLRDLCPFDDGDIQVEVSGNRVTIRTRRTVLDGLLGALAG